MNFDGWDEAFPGCHITATESDKYTFFKALVMFLRKYNFDALPKSEPTQPGYEKERLAFFWKFPRAIDSLVKITSKHLSFTIYNLLSPDPQYLFKVLNVLANYHRHYDEYKAEILKRLDAVNEENQVNEELAELIGKEAHLFSTLVEVSRSREAEAKRKKATPRAELKELRLRVETLENKTYDSRMRALHYKDLRAKVNHLKRMCSMGQLADYKKFIDKQKVLAEEFKALIEKKANLYKVLIEEEEQLQNYENLLPAEEQVKQESSLRKKALEIQQMKDQADALESQLKKVREVLEAIKATLPKSVFA